MSDADAEAALAEAAQQAEADALANMPPEQQLAKLKADLEAQKAINRKLDKRTKADAPKLAELEQLKRAQLTESERNAADRQAADARVAQLEGELLRTRLARAYHLDDELVELLGNGTEEELTARAELLANRVNGRGAQGAGGQAANGSADMQNLISQGNMPSVPQGTAGRVFSGNRPVESLRPGALPAGASTRPTSKNDLFRSMFEKEQ